MNKSHRTRNPMMGNNKILTVSYGTFSCTLEGFDDSFGTMKAIAEYFRDLAADDRYFGAEPPQPDADMLARIAQREVSRVVEAREKDGHIMLRAREASGAAHPPAPFAASDAAATASLSDAGQTVYGNKTDPGEAFAEFADEADMAVVSEAVDAIGDDRAAPEASAHDHATDMAAEEWADSGDTYDDDRDASAESVPTPVSMSAAAYPASMESKLQRIREVVLKRAETGGKDADVDEVRAAALRDIEQALNADDAPDAGAQSATSLTPSDPSVFAEGDSADEETGEDAQVDWSARVIAASARKDDETDAPHAAAVSALSIGAEIYEEDYEDQIDISALRGALSDARHNPTAGTEDETGAPENVFSEAGRASALGGEGIEVAFGEDSIVADDWEDQQALGDEDEDRAIGYDADAEDAHRDEDDLDDEDSFDDADFDFDDDLDDDEDDADLAGTEMIDSADVDLHPNGRAGMTDMAQDDESATDADVHGSSLSEEEEEALRRELAEVESYARPSGKGAALLGGRATDENDISRLMAEAGEKMDDPESSDRRRAFTHLRAAVAAKKADEALGTDDTDDADQSAYRSDLEAAVRPRRTILTVDRAERRAQTRPSPLKLVAEQRVDLDQPRLSEPVRPRRVASLGSQESSSDDGEGFAEFAEQKGAENLPDLLEAAAAYLSFVEGRDDFSRQQLMQRLRQARDGDAFSREDSLRSFGQLIRAGKIEKIRGGRFSASKQIGFKPDHRAAG
ncbi:hypothetical protein AB1M95_15850 [Sulfitobacter sp. LCG007]